MKRDDDREDFPAKAETIVQWARTLAARVRERGDVTRLGDVRAIEQLLGRDPPPTVAPDADTPPATVFPLVLRTRRRPAPR